MPIVGEALPRSADILDQVARISGCEPAVIDAIVRTECGGLAFDPQKRLVIRPETAQVARCPLLTQAQKARAAKLGFTKPVRWIEYGRDATAAGDQRWAWLDRFAVEFGEEAAFWVTSFGLPQMMGFNAKLCGRESAVSMVRAFAESEDNQLIAMGTFMKATGLAFALRTRNWKQIARSYNGVGYRANAYDTHLKLAYEMSTASKQSQSYAHLEDDALEFGDHGDLVKALQKKLGDLGFWVDPDGDFGPETRDAVANFQRRRGLPADGRVDGQTRTAMVEAPAKEPNAKPAIVLLGESPTMQAGASTIATGGIAVTVSAVEAAKSVSENMSAIRQASDATKEAVSSTVDVWGIIHQHTLLMLGVVSVALGVIVILRRLKAQRERRIS